MTRTFLVLVAWLVFTSNSVDAGTGDDDVGTRCYCRPSTSCWPGAAEWASLRSQLRGKLYQVDPESNGNYSESCRSTFLGEPGRYAPSDDRAVSSSICMQHHNCANEFCDVDGKQSNLPAYVVEALIVQDIQTAIAFANKHDIPVTVKATGHNYAGSSSGPDTLLIWMRNFEKQANVGTFVDSCGTQHEAALTIGAGQTWEEGYAAVGDEYNVVGGACSSVSASGGWLMGGGLSALSPSYGLGCDNVLQFEVVSATGELIRADRCSHIDLFWALRGGGGGTFGVLTRVHYRLHRKEAPTMLSAHMAITHNPDDTDYGMFMRTVNSWLDFWVDQSISMDRRWGGYWQHTGFPAGLVFLGSRADADRTFLDAVSRWRSSLEAAQRPFVVMATIEEVPSISVQKQLVDPLGLGDQGGHDEWVIGSWLVPRDLVTRDAARAKRLLRGLATAELHSDPITGARVHTSRFGHYLLGGAVAEQGDSAVSPQLRNAVWQLIAIDKPSVAARLSGLVPWATLMQRMRSQVADGGPGLNHAAKDEPNWRQTFWGPENARRLEAIKRKYDSSNRFNCYHCVGYSRTCADHGAMGFRFPTASSAPADSLGAVLTGFLDTAQSAAAWMGSFTRLVAGARIRVVWPWE